MRAEARREDYLGPMPATKTAKPAKDAPAKRSAPRKDAPTKKGATTKATVKKAAAAKANGAKTASTKAATKSTSKKAPPEKAVKKMVKSADDSGTATKRSRSGSADTKKSGAKTAGRKAAAVAAATEKVKTRTKPTGKAAKGSIKATARLKPGHTMTDEHKAALARGRAESKAVRDYLEAVNTKSRPGRRRTPETIATRLAAIEDKLVDATPFESLQLFQERIDLRAEQVALTDERDLAALEEGFVSAAKSYGSRLGINYNAWRQAGVDAAILKRAGINRGR